MMSYARSLGLSIVCFCVVFSEVALAQPEDPVQLPTVGQAQTRRIHDSPGTVTHAAGGFLFEEILPLPGDPLDAHIYKLHNGLTVYLSVNKSEPRVQTMIAVRAGS